MIKFFKEVYLTGFTIIFKVARVKDIAYKIGSAIPALSRHFARCFYKTKKARPIDLAFV
jgi:hypothetical protein